MDPNCGPYGAGKSSFAIFLANLFSPLILETEILHMLAGFSRSSIPKPTQSCSTKEVEESSVKTGLRQSS